MVLKFVDETVPKMLKTLFYGIDGTGKSTGAKIYCESRGLKPVVIDFDNTNHTGLPRLQCEWSTDKEVIAGVNSIIKDVENDPHFDTLIFDGVGTFNNLLLPKGKESQRTYLVRTQNFKKIWRELLHARIHIIFIGQKDLIVTEDNESSKFAEMINNMVDYKFHCLHTGKGFSNDDFMYICTKSRRGEEPLVGEPITVPVKDEDASPFVAPLKENPRKEEAHTEEMPKDEMPKLIAECIDALVARGGSPTNETVRLCIEDRCKDGAEYDECIRWLDENVNFGGF